MEMIGQLECETTNTTINQNSTSTQIPHTTADDLQTQQSTKTNGYDVPGLWCDRLFMVNITNKIEFEVGSFLSCTVSVVEQSAFTIHGDSLISHL